jgi:hypothetical protein
VKSSWTVKRWLGVGVVDFAIQAAITLCAIGIFVDQPGVRDEPVVFGCLGLSVLVLAIRRHFAMRRADFTEPSGETTAGQMAELELRVSELEAAQHRVMDLEERLDFAERLLSQRADQLLQGPPAGA